MPPADTSQAAYNVALPVKNLIKRPPVLIAPNATVAEAAAVMQNARIGSVLVSTEPPGIVTDRDLRGRALAQGWGPETPITRIMTRPLKTIDSDMPAFAALCLMLEENIHHVPVVEEGKIIGMISASDLLLHEASSPIYLRGAIDNLAQPVDLAHYAVDIATLADQLFHSGLGAVQISQMVSSLNDALIKRLVHLAEQSLGPAPVDFAWIVFGSEGRMEQTLLTDQDNALVYENSPDEASSYFTELSRCVVEGLIQAGFPRCPGGFMATNWCKPLNEWHQLFTGWVRLPEPKALLDAAIFFDFRRVAGTLSLEPLEEVISTAPSHKLFVHHMMKGALELRPPLGFFNRVRSVNGKVDLKQGGIAPIVGLARAAALAAGSRERPTLERLTVAGSSGAVLGQESARLLAEIFPLFLQLRLRAQLAVLKREEALDHSVQWADLSTLEQRHLKEAFIAVKQVQDELRTAWRLGRVT